MACHSDGQGSRRNHQMTVGDIEGHTSEVSVVVSELSCCQVHRISTHISTKSRVNTTEHHLGSVIQAAAACQVIACHALLTAVEYHSILVACYGNSQSCRSDGLITVCHLKDHSGKVTIYVGELTWFKIHISSTRIRSCRLLSTIEGEVGGSVQRIAHMHIIAAYAMFCAIINCGILMSRNGHHNAIHRSNMVITIGHIEGHRVEVAIGIGELVSCQAHVARSHIGTFSGDNTIDQHCGIGRCEGEV